MNRFISWEGCYNTRDLGGLPTTSGTWTRSRRLIRSADPRFITAAGWAAARAAGLRAVIDLRNPDEVTPGSVPSATSAAGMFAVPATRPVAPRPAGLTTVTVPLDDVGDLAFWRHLNEAGLNGTPLYYQPFLAAKPERIAAVLTAIARFSGGGVLFHCTAGRDRTGLISLLLLSLAGVGPDAVADDYELTFGQVTRLYAALGLDQPEPDIRALLRARGTTVRHTITGLLAGLDVAAYLAEAGVSAADITALRTRLR